MRLPKAAIVDPSVFESGAIGNQTARGDEYFGSGDERTLRIVVDHFVSKLEEPQRTAVTMCVMNRIPYSEAAEWFTSDRGIETDKKTVWRWAQLGVSQLGAMFQAAGWAAAIEPRFDIDMEGS